MGSKLGHKHSEETKRKISLALIGNKNPLGCKRSEEHKKQMVNNIKKANTGGKHSEEHKRKIIKSLIGNKRRKGIKDSKETREKKRISLLGNTHTLGRKLSEEHKTKLRQCAIKSRSIKKNKGLPLFPTIGKNEMEILDTIEKIYKIKLIRQFIVLGYFVDGYDSENNRVYEIDESHHFNTQKQIDKDIIRQRNIENFLGCKFVRIKG